MCSLGTTCSYSETHSIVKFGSTFKRRSSVDATEVIEAWKHRAMEGGREEEGGERGRGKEGVRDGERKRERWRERKGRKTLMCIYDSSRVKLTSRLQH